jgi:hypothetical protein
MNKPFSPVILSAAHVILSAAKDLSLAGSSQWRPEILRCAQDDI